MPADPVGAGSPLRPVAVAGGVGAAAVNPALRGLPGGHAPGALLPAPTLRLGLAPVGVGDLARWGGRDVPRPVRERWLRSVEAEGSERGRAGATVTWGVLGRGPFAVHAATTLGVRAALVPDAAELVLFGNAGRTGEARALEPGGSSLDAWAVTRIAASAARGRSLTLAGQPGRGAVGVTVGLTVGHGLLLARDDGTRVDASGEGEVAFPRLETDGALRPAGWGVGVDVGGAWTGGPWSLGALVEGAAGVFTWHRASLRLRSGRTGLGETDDDPPRDGGDPPVLRDALDGAVPPTLLHLEAARRLGVGLVASVGARARLRDGLDPGGPTAGVALGWSVRPGALVRAGLARGGDGWTWSAGAGMRGDRVEAAAGVRGMGSGPAGLGLSVGLRL